MKRFLVLCLTAVAVCGLVLQGRTKSETYRSAAPLVAQRVEKLDPAFYTSLFRHLNHLQKQADSFRKLGKDGSGFQKRFQRMLVLDDDQFKHLDQIAHDWESEVAELDKKAATIVEAFYVRYPPGKVPEGVIIPPPPSELLELEEQRNQVTVKAVKLLRTNLGETEFTRFNEIATLRLTPKSQGFETGVQTQQGDIRP